MTWRKIRNKQEWKNENGVRIVYNPFFENYQIEKKTFFKSASTLEEAKKIAETHYYFK